MCFVKSKPKDETSKSQKSTPQPSPSKSTVADEQQKRPERMSRSQTRRFLYFHNKTLSKIKLL